MSTQTTDQADLVNIVHACDNEECELNGKETSVKPWFFSENGNPVCPECGDDMAYVRTEIVGDLIVVYEVLNGITHDHKWYTDNDDAEADFKARLEENVTDLSADTVEDILDDGTYDDGNGYEIYIVHPEKG